MASFLDKILGRTISPVGQFIDPTQQANLQTDENFYALMGALGGANKARQAGRGLFGTGYEMFTGAKAGKDAVSKSYMDALTGGLAYRKNLQDYDIGTFDLRDKRRVDAGKNFLMLMYPDYAAKIAVAPTQVIEQMMKADPRLRELSKMTVDQEMFARSRGLNPTNPEDAKTIGSYVTGLTEKEKQDLQAKQTESIIQGGEGVKEYLPKLPQSQYEMFNQTPKVDVKQPTIEGQPQPTKYDDGTVQGYNDFVSSSINGSKQGSFTPLVYNKQFPLETRNKLKLEQPKAFGATAQAIDDMNDLKSALLSFRNHVGFGSSTGSLSWLTTWLAGSDAVGAELWRKQIIAEKFMSSLSQLKSQSDTGATGFGQLSLREMDLIMKMATKLDRNMSKKDALAEIDALLDQIDRSYNFLGLEYNTTYGTNAIGDRSLPEPFRIDPIRDIPKVNLNPTQLDKIPGGLANQDKIQAFAGWYANDKFSNLTKGRLNNNNYYLKIGDKFFKLSIQ
jgi:hypothetical protein